MFKDIISQSKLYDGLGKLYDSLCTQVTIRESQILNQICPIIRSSGIFLGYILLWINQILNIRFNISLRVYSARKVWLNEPQEFTDINVSNNMCLLECLQDPSESWQLFYTMPQERILSLLKKNLWFLLLWTSKCPITCKWHLITFHFYVPIRLRFHLSIVIYVR